jgi:two-component system chemotaxis sensor kinase CheA
MLNDETKALLNEFLVEGYEMLDRLDRELLLLEKNKDDLEVINSIFRGVHTIKGTSGFFELATLEAVTHVGETLLDSIRSGKRPMSTPIATALFRLLDSMRTIMGTIDKTGTEGTENFEDLVAELKRLNDAPLETVAAPPSAPVDELEALLAQNRATMWAPPVDAATPSVAVTPPRATETVELSPTPPAKASAREPSTDEGPKSSVTDSSLRVDVGLLDSLMNLVGELVLSRNQILQFSRGQGDAAFQSASQRLNLITSELQEGVMKTRMQPVANVWSKFPRVVRDLSHQLGKQVRLEMEGKETELDKTIIEAIKDPLTHIIRNSIDHGIELPSERASKGKPTEGLIHLRAFHEGGQVIMEIRDDGAGLNTERIKHKALEKGIFTAEQLRLMSDDEVNRIIFMPGFSTAQAVTNVSGRGVGMDVVRANIEKIGGQVDLTSRYGVGTTLRVKIPLTLAIIPALTVSCCQQRYAIPQVVLVELVRADGDQLRLVERIGANAFYRLRGDLLPLVSLSTELGIRSRDESPEAVEGTPFTFIVVRADEQTFGLVVDEVHDTEEIVVKPLGKQLKGLTVFAGATVMGDGNVALIIDVLGLAKRAEIIREASMRKALVAETVDSTPPESFLIVQVAEGYRAAMPLELVHRLEEFPPEAVERASGRTVVQYRSGILPLIDLSEYFSGAPARAAEQIHVVVYAQKSKLVGFVVEKIEDIVAEHVTVHHDQKRPGTLGAAIMQKRVTDLLNPVEIIAERV